jgi:hypothetical protein
MTSVGPTALTALSGAVIAQTVTALVLYAMFAADGYTIEVLVELPFQAFGLILGSGALIGLAAGVFQRRFQMPGWFRLTVLDGLRGVAAVVVPTRGIACFLAGPLSKGQAPYLHAGRGYGVPGWQSRPAAILLARHSSRR